MGCGCKGRTSGTVVAQEILGYDYISPEGVSYRDTNGALLFSYAEARAEQRAHGGGTIRTVRR